MLNNYVEDSYKINSEFDLFYSEILDDLKNNSIETALGFFNFKYFKIINNEIYNSRMNNKFNLVYNKLEELFGKDNKNNPKQKSKNKEKSLIFRQENIFKKIKKIQNKKQKTKKKKKGKNTFIVDLDEINHSKHIKNNNSSNTQFKKIIKAKKNIKSINKLKYPKVNIENYTSITKVYLNNPDNSKSSESALLVRSKVKSLTKPPLLLQSKNRINSNKERPTIKRLISQYDKIDIDDECIVCNKKINYKTEPSFVFVKLLNKNFRDFYQINISKKLVVWDQIKVLI